MSSTASGASPADSGALTLYPGPSGGYILFGFLAAATSAASAFEAGLTRVGPSFDQPPVVHAAVASNDGQLVVAAFTAAYGGTAVGGQAIATYEERGASRAAFVFDRPDTLSASLGPMLGELASITERELERAYGSGGASLPLDVDELTAAARSVPLTMHDFPDGTARIGVAPGYTVNVMQSGRFSASRSDGAYLNIANPIAMLDPRGAMYAQMVALSRSAFGAPSLPPGLLVVPYADDFGPAWVTARQQIVRQRGAADPQTRIATSSPLATPENAFGRGMVVQGTETLEGVERAFAATLIAAPPDGSGNWMISVTILSAPLASVSRDMPELFAMQRSEELDNEALMAQSNASIAASARALSQTLASRRAASEQISAATFAGVMARARTAQAGIDRSAAAFIEYIKGTTWVHDAGKGADHHMSRDLGSALVKADPARFTVVPVSDYKRGVQY